MQHSMYKVMANRDVSVMYRPGNELPPMMLTNDAQSTIYKLTHSNTHQDDPDEKHFSEIR